MSASLFLHQGRKTVTMMLWKLFAILGVISAPLVIGPLSSTVATAAPIEVPRISIEQAKQMIDNPEVVFIDVRTAKSWWRSATKISNAVREELGSVRHWAPKYAKNKILIFYCA